jgi:hypothetical protein
VREPSAGKRIVARLRQGGENLYSYICVGRLKCQAPQRGAGAFDEIKEDDARDDDEAEAILPMGPG